MNALTKVTKALQAYGAQQRPHTDDDLQKMLADAQAEKAELEMQLARIETLANMVLDQPRFEVWLHPDAYRGVEGIRDLATDRMAPHARKRFAPRINERV